MNFRNLVFTHISSLLLVHKCNFHVCFLFQLWTSYRTQTKEKNLFHAFARIYSSCGCHSKHSPFFLYNTSTQFHNLWIIHFWSMSSLHCGTDKESNHTPDKECILGIARFRVQTLVRSRFSTPIQTDPSRLLYNMYHVFARGKVAEMWHWPPNLICAEVKERVPLYLHSAFMLSWHVMGWTFNFFFTLLSK